MDAAGPLSVPHVPANVIPMLLRNMSLKDRFTCALVCRGSAEAATAVTTRSIRAWVQDLSCLQRWLEKHGDQVEVLQLQSFSVLTALPCPQLQDLALWGTRLGSSGDSKVWGDIAAATKLTSVSLETLETASQQAEVVSALTALPDLQQLTWSSVRCQGGLHLTDGMLLQRLTKLTALRICGAKAAALEHLGLLTRLQDLHLTFTDIWDNWAAAGCLGLQELKALTRLEVSAIRFRDIPASVSQLTALQQLDVSTASITALSGLQALTGLTRLRVGQLEGTKTLHWQGLPAALQLPTLQHLELHDLLCGFVPMPSLVGCPELEVLKLSKLDLSPAASSSGGSLFASNRLQQLELHSCRVSAAYGAADPDVTWQQVFPGPGLLPHLTLLKLVDPRPDLQHADIECVVACCSSLQVLDMQSIWQHSLPDNFASALACLSGLTRLGLHEPSDKECSSLAQLTGLRELRVHAGLGVSAAGLVQLATLEQLACLRFRCLPEFVLSSPLLREQLSDELSDGLQSIISKAPAGQPPDVSSRLRRVCDMAAAGGGET